MTNAIVLLSGGMDSAVAYLWALTQFRRVDAVHVDYGQVARDAEWHASSGVYASAWNYQLSDPASAFLKVALPGAMFASKASILGRSAIDQYETVHDAVQNTPNDRSYIPLRNALFITLAAHYLLAKHPEGGVVVVGTRSRSDPGAPAGYPDCTAEFADKMTESLSQGAGVTVEVADPLNRRATPSREDTIRYAMELFPQHGLKVLAHTVTCFSGTACGKCLPCQRRKQAFAAVGIEDPAVGRA